MKIELSFKSPDTSTLWDKIKRTEMEIAKRLVLDALESEEDKLRSAGETEAAYKYAGARMLIEELKA